MGKQQTENISCKTNLYSILFYSMGWSHTTAIEPQGRVFAAQLYTCTLCHRVYSVPVLMDDPWAYSTLGYNRPYSLTLCQHSLSRNQTRWISPAPKPQRVKQPLLPAFYNFWVLLSAKIPLLVLPGPVIISTTCFRFILFLQSWSCASCEEGFRKYFAHLLTNNWCI